MNGIKNVNVKRAKDYAPLDKHQASAIQQKSAISLIKCAQHNHLTPNSVHIKVNRTKCR
jgi:hypothetical protein